jgi:hypothetical protein
LLVNLIALNVLLERITGPDVRLMKPSDSMTDFGEQKISIFSQALIH